MSVTWLLSILVGFIITAIAGYAVGYVLGWEDREELGYYGRTNGKKEYRKFNRGNYTVESREDSCECCDGDIE